MLEEEVKPGFCCPPRQHIVEGEGTQKRARTCSWAQLCVGLNVGSGAIFRIHTYGKRRCRRNFGRGGGKTFLVKGIQLRGCFHLGCHTRGNGGEGRGRSLPRRGSRARYIYVVAPGTTLEGVVVGGVLMVMHAIVFRP